MATKLTKAVSRECRRASATKKGRICQPYEMGRPLVVTINPEETISFRVKGTKTKYTVHLINVFSLAKIVEMEQMYKEKMEQYKLRKNAGLRTRKPRRPVMMDSSLIRRAV